MSRAASSLQAVVGGLPLVFLLPGTLHCSDEPCIVSTVLGSCVSVCLWDRGRALAGINHFVLPHGGRSLRYGDMAIERLLAKMREFDCRIDRIEAKVFGGAAVLPMNKAENNIGTRNVEMALAQLQALDIPVTARRTGGKSGLAIRLFTGTGEVLVRRVPSSVAREADQAIATHDSNRR